MNKIIVYKPAIVRGREEICMKNEEKSQVEQAVCLIKDGKMKLVETPQYGFGKQIITWQNGKPTHIEIQSTKRI